MYSTTSDLVKWTDLLHSGKVVSQESLRKMTSPATYGEGNLTGYGYGLSLTELSTYKKVYHTGSINGFSSILSHYPEVGITIVVFNQYRWGWVYCAIEEFLARELLNVKVLDLPVTPKEISRFEGLYYYKSAKKNIEIHIYGKGINLLAKWGDEKPFRLLSQGQMSSGF